VGVRGELVGGLKVSSLHFEGREPVSCSMAICNQPRSLEISTFARLIKNKRSTYVDLN